MYIYTCLYKYMLVHCHCVSQIVTGSRFPLNEGKRQFCKQERCEGALKYAIRTLKGNPFGIPS